jgi:hypothetical protein
MPKRKLSILERKYYNQQRAIRYRILRENGVGPRHANKARSWSNDRLSDLLNQHIPTPDRAKGARGPSRSERRLLISHATYWTKERLKAWRNRNKKK